MIFFTVMSLSVFFLFRTGLIMFGLLKSPVIGLFERYGDEERVYLPLLPLLVWGGIFVISCNRWAVTSFGVTVSLDFLGAVMLAVAFYGYQNYDQVVWLHAHIFPLPRWYYHLCEYTTRYERRRIGYMWLLLPWKMRLRYNSDARSFFHWVDFIVMATILDEDRPLNDATITPYSMYLER